MELSQIEKDFLKEIEKVESLEELQTLKVKYLGRKGALTQILRSLKELPLEERKKIGKEANVLKEKMEKLILEKEKTLKEIEERKKLEREKVDLTCPGKKISLGHLHPLSLVLREIKEIFQKMGFEVVEGPEIETCFYNFDALNVPEDHPARDLWSTLWLEKNYLLRTHTSPVQVRYLEKHQPPFRIIAPGRVFRHERTDAHHEIQFYQVEGLMVGKDVSLANFKAVILHFFKEFFKEKVEIRLRPSYFPFTEPSVEVDIRLSAKRKAQSAKVNTKGKAQSAKEEGWLEVMGAGMVHPKVFEAARLNPLRWQGFAFGVGVDRLAMIKYKIPDIRLFYQGDLRFIRQF